MPRSTSLPTSLALLVLVACGGGADAPPAEAPPAETEATPAAVEWPAFDETFELQGITFHVTSPNSASGNTVQVTPAGLSATNEPMVRDIDGVVTGAELADLNADGSPEVYVYTRAGSDERGGLVAYAANNKASLSEVYLPPLTDDAKASAGYAGFDEFTVVELVLARQFPVFAEGRRTGATRQLLYKLTPGEAGWRLQLDRTSEY